MQVFPIFSLALFLSGVILAPAHAQTPAQGSVSSDDISVADGLQLPTFGHVWALDTWKGLHELVRLRPPDATSQEPGFSIKLHRAIEFKGEAAMVRLHDTSPVFFVRGVSGNDNGRSDLAIVHLNVEAEHRRVTKDAMTELKLQAKNGDSTSPNVIGITQKRVGSTDWYRLTLRQALGSGEYALIPLPSSSGFADDEIFDFAIDPAAPENIEPLRSEQYRGAQ
jgi:hypothetical protein